MFHTQVQKVSFNADPIKEQLGNLTSMVYQHVHTKGRK